MTDLLSRMFAAARAADTHAASIPQWIDDERERLGEPIDDAEAKLWRDMRAVRARDKTVGAGIPVIPRSELP